MQEKMRAKQEESKIELKEMLSDIEKLKQQISTTEDIDHLYDLSKVLVQKIYDSKDKQAWIDSRASLFKV